MTQRRPQRSTAAILGAGAVLVLGLAGCQSGSDSPKASPKDASKAAFCKALNPPEESGGSDDAARYASFEKSVEELRETGTPKGISDDARRGYELVLEQSEKVSEDEYADWDPTDGLSKDEQKKFDAFLAYGMDACEGVNGG